MGKRSLENTGKNMKMPPNERVGSIVSRSVRSWVSTTHRPYSGLRVNSAALGWVGAPNKRAPLRVHDAIAVFAAPCLTRTRIEDQGLGGVHEDCAGFAYSA